MKWLRHGALALLIGFSLGGFVAGAWLVGDDRADHERLLRAKANTRPWPTPLAYEMRGRAAPVSHKAGRLDRIARRLGVHPGYPQGDNSLVIVSESGEIYDTLAIVEALIDHAEAGAINTAHANKAGSRRAVPKRTSHR